MIECNKKAARSRSGNLESLGSTNSSLPDLAGLMSPQEAVLLPEVERQAYFVGFHAGVSVAGQPSYDHGHRIGYDEGLDDGHVLGHKAGWEAAQQAHDDAISQAARDTVRPFLDWPPYWEMAVLRGEPDRAKRALARAKKRGYFV